MNKIIMAAIVWATISSCESEKTITGTEIPSKITTYINTHFSDHDILQATTERDDFTKTYEILLDENIKLEFNRKQEIIDIDGVSKLPDSVIPASILAYVTTNYPDNFITDWELDDRNQQVELNNEIDLKFNMDGKFLRIDA